MSTLTKTQESPQGIEQMGELLDFRPIGLKEQYVFITTATETDGELVVMEATLSPNTPWSGPPHIHFAQEEQYEVLYGTLDVLIDGEKKKLCAGERLAVPIGTPHTFGNYSDKEVTFISEHRPALRFQQMMERFYAPVKAGEVNNINSVKAMLMQAIVLQDHQQEMVFANPLMRGMTRILAVLGRRWFV